MKICQQPFRGGGLALTAKQRDEILQNLRSTFGEEVTKGMKAGHHQTSSPLF